MNESTEDSRNRAASYTPGPSGAVYGLGVIGALVYYIQHATSFGAGLLGVIKAFLWPGLFVYKAIELLKF